MRMEMCPYLWCIASNSAISVAECLSSSSGVTFGVCFPPEVGVVGPFRSKSMASVGGGVFADGVYGGIGGRQARFHMELLVCICSTSLASSSSSEIIPPGNAMRSISGSTIPASTQKTLNCLYPGAIMNVAILSFRPRSICLWYECPLRSQYRTHSLPSVRSPYVCRLGRLLRWVCAQCWGLSRQTRPSGM